MAKKIDKARLAWLDEELSDLSGQGVIEESVAQRIRMHYEPAVEDPVLQSATSLTAPAAPAGGVPQKTASVAVLTKQKYVLIVLVVLGVFMVGSGVVLLFAHNWDMLSTRMRIITALIPVILAACCGAYTIVKEKDTRWQEGSAFLTATGFAVLTAIVSQIYHTGGTMLDFSKLMMLVSLPLVYLFRAHMLAAVYCVFLFILNENVYYEQYLSSIFYVAGIAPYILYYLFFHKPAGMRTAWMRYICLLPLVWLILRFEYMDTYGMNYFAAAGLLYSAGLYYSEKKQGGWRNPWLICGWLFFTIFLLFTRTFLYFRTTAESPSILWYAFLAVQIFVATRRVTPLKVAIAVITVLPVVLILSDKGHLLFFGANICLLLLGVIALWEGTKERGLIKINAGMVQIASLALVKFADERISIVLRALIFITIGIAFIFTNIRLSKKFGSKNMLAMSESEVQNDVEK